MLVAHARDDLEQTALHYGAHVAQQNGAPTPGDLSPDAIDALSAPAREGERATSEELLAASR